MKRLTDTSLAELNSFGVATHADEVLVLESEADLAGLGFDPAVDLLLGGGSNVLLAGDVPGRVLLNRLPGRRVASDDGEHAVVEAAAGENWHQLVRWSLDQGLNGLENLSLIPGLVGAAPMQNIGAYGVELREHLESVTAWDLHRGELRELDNSDCAFGYRDSRFKTAEPDRWLVTAIRLRLSRRFEPRLDYAGIADELRAAGVNSPGARDVSDAVVRIRSRKLPDPALEGNAGSFFKNPVVPATQADALSTEHAALPRWPAGEGSTKLSAAWLLEHCGWKGQREGDAGFSARHALVLVNHGRASGEQLLGLAARAAHDVHQHFGLWLEPEPRIVGAPWPHPTPPIT